jgi:hypothetical protein
VKGRHSPGVVVRIASGHWARIGLRYFGADGSLRRAALLGHRIAVEGQMRMRIETIGGPLFECDSQGRLVSRVATIFPRRRVLVTLPGTHAWQRVAFCDYLNQQRVAEDAAPLTAEQEAAEYAASVDLIVEPGLVLIRPDPANMGIAFEADELLQELVSKRSIKFLQVTDQSVRQAIKGRGECWRISALPRSVLEMQNMIKSSKIGIQGLPIYNFNNLTGTRFLTLEAFSSLEKLAPDLLARHLQEIQEYSQKKNRLQHPEVDFFLAGDGFGAKDFAGLDFSRLDRGKLLAIFGELRAKFARAVPPAFHRDDLNNTEWRNRMFIHLVGHKKEILSEEILQGLSPEFFLQIEWLPGGRIEEGELIFDSVFDEPEPPRPDDAANRVDPKAKGFIFNFIREFGDLQYVNLGRVVSSLSQRPKESGRREVYIAEIKPQGPQPAVVRIMRMQKWGIAEHLAENKDLLTAIMESEQYTEYTLDRRLGCRQLGMNLPERFDLGRISEPYTGPRVEHAGCLVWATYFERAYVYGVATDKVPHSKYADSAFALQFAHLMGKAAAANIIVGRTDAGNRVLFDDGDEVLVEDANGMVVDIMVADFTGAFREYQKDLLLFASDYALPIVRRLSLIPDPTLFSRVYVDGFISRFTHIQLEYRKRRRAFDTLFKHRPRDEKGSFSFRWEKILERLDRSDPVALGKAIEAYNAPR